MIEFRHKRFSLLTDMAKGASMGAFIGGFGNAIYKPEKGESRYGKGERALIAVGGGTIIGAALGLLYGLTKEGTKSLNRSTTANDRLLETVVDNLKKAGLREDKDFTRDPKRATELKTKVCIVVSRTNGDLKLLVNTVSDFKLSEITKGMTKHLPNSSNVTKKFSDKFNDVTISTISDSSADSGLITGIAEYYIHNHYPVYLVEVG